MRLVIVTILTMILLGGYYPYTANAATSSGQSSQELVKLSREILVLSKQQEYEHALSLLQHFSEVFLQDEKANTKLSMNELRLVSNGYTDAKDALNAVSLTDEERTNSILSFHLLVDALYSENQPLWKNMDNQVIQPLEQMTNSLEKRDKKAFGKSFSEFKSKYNQIKPALEADLEPDQINRLDSYISYLDEFEGTLFNKPEQTIQHVNLMKEEFLILFDQTEKESTDLSLPLLIFSIGGVIVSTLIYVGWIKYKAERDKVRKVNRES